jgi:hypothetical protein
MSKKDENPVNDLDLKDLEEVQETGATEAGEKKARKTAKEAIDAELQAKVDGAINFLTEIKASTKFSENFFKILPLASAWTKPSDENPEIVDKDALNAAKDATYEAFGGSELLKNYFDDGFTEDSLKISGLQKLSSILNNMFAFYHRRKELSESSGRIKRGYINYTDPETGQVNVYEYDQSALGELINDASVSKDEKIKAVFEHPRTKKLENFLEL